VEHFEDMDEPT